jgi:hypothetical protein
MSGECDKCGEHCLDWVMIKNKVPEELQDCWVCQYDNTITRGEYINFHEIFGSGFGSYEEFIEDKYVRCWKPYYTPKPPE